MEECFDWSVLIVEIRKMTAEELLERYADGERNFMGIELIETEISGKINLQRCDLLGINLHGAYLSKVDFTEANLSEADLRHAFLAESTLEMAVVRDANLMCANLVRSNLHKADFRGSNLDYMNASLAFCKKAWFDYFKLAILFNTNFRMAYVDGKSLWIDNDVVNSIMPDGTRAFPGNTFPGDIFPGDTFPGSIY